MNASTSNSRHTLTASAAHRQLPYTVRLEWGFDGAATVASGADLAVVVDVLSFSTCVSVALDRGASVFPFPWKDTRAEDFAAHHRAQLAGPRNGGGLSLSPASFRAAETLERVVLPSPNGSALCHELAGTVPLVAAVCLRNAGATADWVAANLPENAVIAVIAAGERWPDGTLRPAVEDQIGAGAFIAGLGATGKGGYEAEVGRHGYSPEAVAAAAVFEAAEPRLREMLHGCASGLELSGTGYGGDVDIAAELDDSTAVALLTDGVFSPFPG
ncbi:phosphosulfolactate phosphohydrolase-like enzyme [Pseudarthrobacter phenanthrenivorans Sphe3]|uniref:Probable 2-phosphosulfolactate phosphatase n=1 Tax=Pseudarthrobacter phenanthrenivorans (strain DSM 18606 / JCM 16027 / LMG 23796 / Sphe3) TaxID=930171 RepID=F0M649_PSEPM|nr:2-phosphosulfolactate phosphatase [Pseudarthrobacter phenanthrenivorans]ADX74705.1 phosphosulfolactate phosphohydrolase-like enzyme [Pseudarthrobacter phenanthrenivorans Sphe3]